MGTNDPLFLKRKDIIVASTALRRMVLAVLLLLITTAYGCSTYHYEYVLDVRSTGRHLAKDPSGFEYIGFDPADVTIQCDGKTTHAQFKPYGETKTIRFAESYRIMIDGNAYARGFTVRIDRPGYKPWYAAYGKPSATDLMSRNADTLIRLDSVLLAPEESPDPSVSTFGGPVSFVNRSGHESPATRPVLPIH